MLLPRFIKLTKTMLVSTAFEFVNAGKESLSLSLVSRFVFRGDEGRSPKMMINLPLPASRYQ